MRVLIVSDTHGRNSGYLDLLEQSEKMDMVIHCGDVEGSEYLISESAGCKTVIVQGNNDYFSGLPHELTVQLGKYKVWITHGHTYGIYSGNARIEQEMNRRGADFAVVGHTHIPKIEWCGEDKAIINPGSISLPRQPGRQPSYAIMEIDRDEQVHFTVCCL